MSQTNSNTTVNKKAAIVDTVNEKHSTRNFYATKPTTDGKEATYAFKRVEERKEWMNRKTNADSKVVRAIDVYRNMDIKRGQAIVATRTNKVIVVPVDKIDEDKGQRLILS